MRNLNLTKIFRPSTMAVVGVSTSNLYNPGTVIYRKNRFLKRDRGVYGINPKGGIIEGAPLFQDLEDVPEKIDLVVTAVRAEPTVEVLETAGKLGVKGAIVVSGGFAEAGREDLQEMIVEIARRYDMGVIGPNCVGVFNPPHVDTFFIPSERFVRPKFGGNTALVSQSGGILADQFFGKFHEWEIPISAAVSVGNKAVVGEIELLDYFAHDPATRNIIFYVEGFDRGREFLHATTMTNKNVMVYRGGISEYGSRAVQSHTASVASSPKLTSCAFKQFGIIEIRNEQELVNFAKIFSTISRGDGVKPFLTKMTEGDVVVLSVSGGHGVIAADLLKKYDLKLVQFTPDDVEVLKSKINPSAAAIASFSNPIDLTGSVVDDDIVNSLETLLKMDKVEGILLLVLPYPPLISMHLGNRIQSLIRLYRKPIVAYLPRLARYGMIIEALEEGNIPCANSIEQAVEMMYAIRLKSLALLRRDRNKIVDFGDADEYAF
ncbi:MAG: CoA-binding protein [Promethearchaeota archaeon]